MSIEDASQVENDSGVSQASLTLFLDHVTDHDVFVDYTTSNGTATTGADYTSSSGTTRIPAGQATATVDITVNADRTDEPDETFTVALSNPYGASIGDPTGHGTITDDDPGESNSVTISDANVREGNSGTATHVFRIGLEDPRSSPTTVDYTTLSEAGTAEPSDFVARSESAKISAHQTSTIITVKVNGDKAFGPDENLQVRLSNAQGSSNPEITDATGVGTIVNDDTAVNLETSNAQGDRVHVPTRTSPDAPGKDVVIYRQAAGALRTLWTGALNPSGRLNRTLPNEFNRSATVRLFAKVTTSNGNYWSDESTVTIH